jgi:lipopolysaccharide export LptBFGC system permease protein LptF
MPVASLRERALAMKDQGRPREAGSLLIAYHVRGALVGAALAFALFGMGVTTLRFGRAATAGMAFISCGVYITYVFELSTVSESVFSDERVALTMAWLPNLLLILTAVAFSSARHETRIPTR